MQTNYVAILIEQHADHMRIVWDDEGMNPVRELVYVGGYNCWETRWIDGFKRIIETSNFNEALSKLINP